MIRAHLVGIDQHLVPAIETSPPANYALLLIGTTP
jgi:hypothetical protein